jgi:hypothetical protein
LAVQPGFADLKPKRVVDFDPRDSTLVCVDDAGKFTVMGLYVGPSGSLMARPVEVTPIDQLVTDVVSIRHRGVDQV